MAASAVPTKPDKWGETVAAAQTVAKAEKPNGSLVPSSPKAVEKLNKTVLVSASTWDAFLPPPSNSFKGKVVPRVVNRFSNRRKVSIEVHKVIPLTKETDSTGKTHSPSPYEECVVRLLAPADRQKNIEFRREAFFKIRKHEGSNETYEGGGMVLDEELDEDDSSIDPNNEKASALAADTTGGKHFDGWKPKYRFPCHAITVESQHNNIVYLMIRIEEIRQERELIFDTVEDADKFCSKLEEERKSEIIRSKARLQSSLGDIKLAPYEKISLLFEIVSGWDLPIGDLKTSDPFVVCMFGRREVHKTRHIPSTLDPIWTVKTGSLFLLEVESEQLFLEDGMKFLVKDFDQFGSNETLGLVHVPPRTLYRANGERMEFKLQPVPGKTAGEVPGYLAIRCRRATTYDKTFMQGMQSSMKAIAAPKLPKSQGNAIKSMVTKTSKNENGVKKFKVRPGPDPQRRDQTEWMSKDEIESEMMKPSQFWTDAGTGTMGRIFLEILSAHGLPNMDTGSWLGNLTDSFVSIVYEDVYVRTDTIDDCLDPVWLPWTHRAFILNMGHASSQISIGVFDFDAGFSDHDLIGRVSVDLTNLRPNTEYLLTYNLYPSARVSGRDIQGKIRIRLRLDIPDERKVALSVLEPPHPIFVNMKKGKDFRVIRQTCLGKHDVETYNMKTLRSYMDELMEYQHVLMYLEDALMTLLLWRGHFPVKIGGKEYLIPIHSFNAFVVAVVLVERPEYYPSFCFAVIAWIMLAIMGWRRKNPDVWARCYSFAEIMEKIVVGKCSTPPHDIKPFQDFDVAKQALERWMNRLKEAEERAQRAQIEAEKEEAERLKELEEIGETDGDMSTKVGGGISIDPMKAVLHPVQLILGSVCEVLRFVKHVLYWEEAYFSFWITFASAVLAIVCLFVPWFFLIRWTARIVVWTIFGPWMKLVDIFYVSQIKPETDDERMTREQREKQQRRLATSMAAKQARLARENVAKMRDMKCAMFGRFSMKIPLLKMDRYIDRPLPESSAVPYKEKAMTLAELAMQEAGYNRVRLPGQTLVGDMIPRVESDSFTKAPTGKATSSPEKLAKDTPGGGTKQNSDSTVTAYVYIGSLVTVASVITFFGVPILASYTEFAVGMVQKFRSN